MPSTVIDTFEAHRSKLTGLTYRITGSFQEAEDIVHETFLKWFDADHQAIRSPYSWLVKVATRMSLDHLKSARSQRQSYIGPWLPEPFIADNDTPESIYEIDESITIALLVLFEQLSPGERASFILHDLFHFSFDEIGEILDKAGLSCRKQASRAREKINANTLLRKSNKDDFSETVSAFFHAVKDGNIADLVSLLKENVVFHADGGGKAIATLSILKGVDAVTTFLIEKLMPDFVNADLSNSAVTQSWFNGSPGFVIWIDSKPVSAFNFEIENRLIQKIHVLRNPEKLRFFGASSSKTNKML